MNIETHSKLLEIKHQIYVLENSYISSEVASKLYKLKTSVKLLLAHSDKKISNEKFDKLFEMLQSDDKETVDLVLELIEEYERL